MFRRSWIASTAVLIVFGCGESPSTVGSTGSARHVILVTIDTLRADHLSCYGYARSTSDAAHAKARGSIPGFTIDEIAAQGVRFQNAYSPRGMTFPAIVTLFTGKPPIETCALENGNILPADASTLAERMHAKGFKTAAFTSNKLLVPGSGIEQGFEHFFTDASEDKDARAVDAACAWLTGQDLEHGPPLFVWLHLTGPHLAYDPATIGTSDFAHLFTDPAYTGQANGSRAFVDGTYTAGRPLDAADVAQIVALYDGEVARIDHLVSRFLAFCAGRDAAQPVDMMAQSLLLFTADHGEELHEHNRYFGHSKSVYEDVLHVPLIVRDPSRAAGGKVVRSLVGLEDVFATLVGSLDLADAPSVHGRSFVNLLRGKEDGQRPPQFSLWRDRIFSVRTDRWRLVWNPDRIEPKETPSGPYPVPEVALFDWERDPSNLTDVSGAHADIVKSLQESIRAWREGLRPCLRTAEPPTPERLKALQDLGYAGTHDDEDPPKKK